ncbi:MAG TPA: TM2 domain-containing protein [Bacillales bacterium]|nr:TM2 domain-containing protein [Bacillales bacterium]
MSILLEHKSQLTDRQLTLFQGEYEKARKNPVVVWLLWIFLAGFAAHRFYLGNIGYAIAMLLLGWLTLFIWPIVDAFFLPSAIRRANEEIEYKLLRHVRNI